jgi:hypothetical protein
MLPNAKNTASTTASHHQLYFNLTAPLSESLFSRYFSANWFFFSILTMVIVDG